MSKYDEYLVPAIAELLEELCPEGVEVVPTTNTVDFIRGLTYSKAEENLLGDVTVLRANNISLQTSRLDFADLKRITRKNKPIRPDLFLKANDILMATNSGSKQHAGKTTFITDDMPNVAFGGFMAVLRTKPGVNARYIYQLLSSRAFSEYKNQVLQSSTINNIKQSTLEGFEIPLPPLEVQEQIVTILDTFTDLDTSLNRELELREAQSARYRELLLSFSEGQNGSRDPSYPVQAIAGLLEELGTGSVPTEPLSDFLLDLRTGLNPRKNFTLNTPDADNHYITVRELGGFTIEPTPDTDLVNGEGLTKISRRCHLEQNDILFSGVGTIGRTAIVQERPTNWGIKEGIFALTLDPSRADSRYMIYWFHSSHFKSWLASVTSHGSMATISMANLKKAPVPLPSLNIQQHIVAILDMFTDYTANLRREIDLRRQQLEYYREQLLTFPVAE